MVRLFRDSLRDHGNPGNIWRPKWREKEERSVTDVVNGGSEGRNQEAFEPLLTGPGVEP